MSCSAGLQTRPGLAAALAMVVLAMAGAHGAGAAAGDTAAIDAVFADYDKPGSPGCMLGVVKDGALTYSRGYGRANLEHDVPFSADTIFDIGSTSKQFMATAILLLAADGKLSLDDDVRTYVPELPDYGAPITIRHLLTHTSGLRDYVALMALGGWQIEDLTTPALALDVIRRQRALDFPAGTEFAYSNTGYFLPSIIVERVSGKPLGVFARERIFQPAGMTLTRYMDDHSAMVPRRATGYDPAGDAFRVSLSNWEQLGDGAVQTSVNELVKWDANFYTPKVGGPRLVAQLQEEGRLSNGKPIGYGLGLFLGKYRGLPTVRHGGSWAGYRAELLRFPDERMSVIVLCNLGTADAGGLANRVADTILSPRFNEPAPARTQAPDGDSRAVAGFAGVYWNANRMGVLRFVAHERGLALATGGEPRPLAPSADGKYRTGTQNVHFRFIPGDPRRVERQSDDDPPVTFIEQAAWTPAPDALDAFAGVYFSEELQTRWRLERDGASLVVRDLRQPSRVLRPAFRDAFTGDGFVAVFDTRSARPSFVVGAGRARGMAFLKE